MVNNSKPHKNIIWLIKDLKIEQIELRFIINNYEKLKELNYCYKGKPLIEYHNYISLSIGNQRNLAYNYKMKRKLIKSLKKEKVH